jgi:hypothetical protein
MEAMWQKDLLLFVMLVVSSAQQLENLTQSQHYQFLTAAVGGLTWTRLLFKSFPSLSRQTIREVCSALRCGKPMIESPRIDWLLSKLDTVFLTETQNLIRKKEIFGLTWDHVLTEEVQLVRLQCRKKSKFLPLFGRGKEKSKSNSEYASDFNNGSCKEIYYKPIFKAFFIWYPD